MASRAERVENELVALLDWIERYFAVRDLLPPPAIAAGVASARAALALPADAPAQPAPEGAGEAVAWAARDGFGKVVVFEPTERKAKAQSVRRALDVGGGPLPVFPLYHHPTPRAEAASAEKAAKAEAAAHRQEALARKTTATAMRVVEALPCYLVHTPEQTHLCHACQAREAIRSLPLPAAPASAEAVAREAASECASLADDMVAGRPGAPITRGECIDRAVAHALRAKGAK